MDLVEKVVPYAKAFEAVEPTDNALGDPTVNAQPAAMFCVTAGDVRLDASLTQFLPVRIGVVGTVGVDFIRTLARPAGFASYGRDAVDQGDQLRHVRHVGPREDDVQGDALGFGGDVVLASRFAAVGGVRAGVLAAPKSPHNPAVHGDRGEIQLVGLAQAVQQDLLQLIPDARPLPRAEATPTGHSRPAAHLLRQVLPGNAGLEHEEDSGQCLAIVDRRPAPFRARRVLGQERLNDFPQLIGKKRLGHDWMLPNGRILATWFFRKHTANGWTKRPKTRASGALKYPSHTASTASIQQGFC